MVHLHTHIFMSFLFSTEPFTFKNCKVRNTSIHVKYSEDTVLCWLIRVLNRSPAGRQKGRLIEQQGIKAEYLSKPLPCKVLSSSLFLLLPCLSCVVTLSALFQPVWGSRTLQLSVLFQSCCLCGAGASQPFQPSLLASSSTHCREPTVSNHREVLLLRTLQ